MTGSGDAAKFVALLPCLGTAPLLPLALSPVLRLLIVNIYYTMAKSIIALSVAALATVANATTVAVLELGKGGVVHRTSDESTKTTPNGVVSFMKSMHDIASNGEPRKERATQYPGMSVVPDLFNRADGGVVIGILGESIDLASMPTVAAKMEDAPLYVEGNKGRDLMKKLASRPIDAAEFEKTNARAPASNQVESVSVLVKETSEAASVDATVSRILSQISKEAESNGSTVVVHLVVDDETSRRRLEDANGNADDDDDAYNDIKQNQYYKSMSQIQYYNITLWTALGLIGILAASNLMTMYMPLMPDTLLFGESAKMVAE